MKNEIPIEGVLIRPMPLKMEPIRGGFGYPKHEEIGIPISQVPSYDEITLENNILSNNDIFLAENEGLSIYAQPRKIYLVAKRTDKSIKDEEFEEVLQYLADFFKYNFSEELFSDELVNIISHLKNKRLEQWRKMFEGRENLYPAFKRNS